MKISMVLVAAGSIVIGFFPHLVMDIIEKAVPTFIQMGL